MAKRGFLAEVLYQQQLAEKRRAQAQAAAARAQAAAAKDAARASAAATRARQAAERASAADKKRAEQEAKRLHEEARAAEVAEKNAEIGRVTAELESILAATLEVDDFVDLEGFRQRVLHPAFDRPDLQQPIPPPPPIPVPPEPVYVEPLPPTGGLGGLLGGRKKHQETVQNARAEHALAHEQWRTYVGQLPAQQLAQIENHQRLEAERKARLDAAWQTHLAECSERERIAAEANGQLDRLLAGLAANEKWAVEEYVSIVLSNSVYPESFPVQHVFEFDQDLAELELTAWVPAPAEMPTVKEYAYIKARDEVVSKPLPARDLKARYAEAIAQTALRTLHEVFEADRSGRIATISLTVATETIDPATGLPKQTGLAAVAADRSRFTSFDLANVTPTATLQHLNAVLSKDPWGLVGIDTSKGVRG